jgi:hypothetical protein
MHVLASTAEVAKASCANFDKEIGSQGKYAINQVREEDSSHFLLDCVFRLNSNADSWSD